MELIEKEIIGRSFINLLDSIKTFYSMNDKITNSCNETIKHIRVKMAHDRQTADAEDIERLLHKNHYIMEN